MLSIKGARVNANLEQVEVAKKLGMTKKTYINYEKYRSYFRVDKAYEFARIVNCQLSIGSNYFFTQQLHFKCK